MIDYNQKIMEKDEWWTEGEAGELCPSIKCPPEISVGWYKQFVHEPIFVTVEIRRGVKLLPEFDFEKYFTEHPEELKEVFEVKLEPQKTLTGLGEH